MHENKKNLLDGSLAQYNDTAVPKIPVFAGNDITSEFIILNLIKFLMLIDTLMVNKYLCS